MKWLVNGANSFSGKAFCGYLERSGESVRRFSRSDGFDLNHPHLGFFNAQSVIYDPDYVVNFAALNMVADSWAHYDDYYQTNVVGVSRFVRMCMSLKSVKRFIQVSTPEVYGSTGTFLHETAPYNPSTPYAVSRAACDMDLEALHKTYGFPVNILRSVNVYGNGQQPYRIIPKTTLKILRGEKLRLEGGGVSTRSFIHIDDVAQSIVDVATKGKVGEVYHTSTPAQTSIRKLVEDICALLGVDFEQAVELAPERPGKDMAYQLHSNKIFRDTGWMPTRQLWAELPRVVAWFKDRAADYKDNSLEYEHRR